MTEHPTSPYPGPPGRAPEGGGPDAGGGATWIADDIVAKVAAAAAREVDGVEGLKGGGIRRGWVRASERRRGGASVRVEEGRVTVALRLVVRYGVSIPTVVEDVRARVVERVEFATGLSVARVDIGVVDVVHPEQAPPEDAPGVEASFGPV
jgi:uncharacterized alkaline shock family protein YloU